MPSVRIYSHSRLIAQALGDLVSSLGYSVQFADDPPAELALWDLCCCEASHPPSPFIPPLALLSGNKAELVLQDLVVLRHQGVWQGGEGQEALKWGLESLTQEGRVRP